MISSFITSYKLKNTYRVNSILYTLRHTPLLKGIFSYDLHHSKGVMIFAYIISTIIELFSLVIGKILYFSFFYLAFVHMYNNQQLAFVNIFAFLTLIGGFMNTFLFNPSVDKYYAIYLLKFDAKKYTLCNYFYYLFKSVLGFFLLFLIYGPIFDLPKILYLIIPLYVFGIKNIFNACSLIIFKNKKIAKNENKTSSFITLTIIVLLCLAYGLPKFDIGINITIMYYLIGISFILGIIGLIYISKFDQYTSMCKGLIKNNLVISNSVDSNNKMYKNQITNSDIKVTNKTGYAYFNYIFTMRHRKLLTKASKNISIGAVLVFIILDILCIIYPSKNVEINNLLKNCLPYFLFILYFVNRGEKICRTMFMNCDRSMLTYRFYRRDDSILALFKERLKTLVKLNIIPGALIALGTDSLIFMTGGASVLIYIVTFLTIVSMSILFSVHYLVIYYLLQPYNVNLDVKDPSFMAISSITYFICYLSTKIQVPTLIFGVCMCTFTIIYSFLSLFLAYKYAPKNFKLKL